MGRERSAFGDWLQMKNISAADFANQFNFDLPMVIQLIYNEGIEVTHEMRDELRKAIRAIDPIANTYTFWT